MNVWDDVTAVGIPAPRPNQTVTPTAERAKSDHPDAAPVSKKVPSRRPGFIGSSTSADPKASEEQPGPPGSATHLSGTHRISRRDHPGVADLVALEVPQLLPRDELCSIIAAYVSCVNQAQAALQVHETLERLGMSERPVPQALAGHLVLSLSNRIFDQQKRAGFLAHAWGILGSTAASRRAERMPQDF